MIIRFADTAPVTSPIAYPIAKGGLADAAAARIDPLLRAAAHGARFDGEAASVVEAFVASGAGTRRVLLVGTGGGTVLEWEKAGGALAAKLLISGETTLAVDLSGSGADADAAALLAAGARQRAWRYDVYRTRLADKLKPTLGELVVIGAPDGIAAAWAHQDALTQGIAFTRALVTEPPNILYPAEFVARCRDMADLGVTVTVLDEGGMRAAGMGALLGVSQGSRREAQLLVLHWNGTGKPGDPPLALVGKGVTFDTGGISLKPPPGMEDMKWDMGGAGAVAGAIRALALRKARANVVGICGLVENMPDGNAQRPGDIVTSMSGQTIEVLNTDAEGRLVLCDAITWVQKHFRPKTIVDLATLTGAMIVALGNEHGGLFANDDALADRLLAAGKAVGDPLWRFPLSDAYNKLIDSPVADMKNVGPRGAGSITAAQFIQRFVDEGVAWAHLDIAGMVWADKAGPTWDKGATGYGVRLLDRFVRDHYEA